MRQPTAYFVTVMDADPKTRFPDTRDGLLMNKYEIALKLMGKMVGGKAAVCIHTSPRYRDRFFRAPFLEFWREWRDRGGDLLLHPEEDLYSVDTEPGPAGPRYFDRSYMEDLVLAKKHQLKQADLAFSGFRGGFFGMTDSLADLLQKADILADLSAAPGIVRSERAADWRDAPASAYFMAPDSYRCAAKDPASKRLFEIPLGWDGTGNDLGCNYLFHERSTLRRLSRVWDRIAERSARGKSIEMVHLLCHSYSMRNQRLVLQLEKVLAYLQERGGVPLTISEARSVYEHSGS